MSEIQPLGRNVCDQRQLNCDGPIGQCGGVGLLLSVRSQPNERKSEQANEKVKAQVKE